MKCDTTITDSHSDESGVNPAPTFGRTTGGRTGGPLECTSCAEPAPSDATGAAFTREASLGGVTVRVNGCVRFTRAAGRWRSGATSPLSWRGAKW